MGAYLAHPITKTEPEDGGGNRLEYGASCMQGWRVSQEDAHNCVLDFDEGSSFFAVYDGHGGSEVAVYLSQHLPEFLKVTDAYKKGNYKEALSEAYLRIDESIRTPDVLKEIVRLSKFGKSAEEIDGHEEEDVNELFEEATMPIELLVAKYKDGKSLLEKLATKLQDSNGEKPGSSKALRKVVSDDFGTSSASTSKTTSASSSFDETNGEKDVEVEPTSLSSSSLKPSEKNKNDSTEVSSTSSSVTNCSGPSKPKESCLQPDSLTISSLPSSDTHRVKINGEGINSENDDAVISSNGVVMENGNAEIEVEKSMEVESDIREESILVEPKKKKGKVHPPPIVQVQPKPSPEKRTSPRKTSENKVYMDFLTGESTSEESEDDVDPITFKAQLDSDSDDDGSEEAEADTSSDDDDDDDATCEDEDEQENEDDEMLKDYQEPGYDSGATAVTAFTRWEGTKLHLWVANAGDSRCVVSRNGIALEMSEDHKPEDEREALRIVNAGGKVTAEGRVNGGLNLSRAIGDHSYKTNPTLSLQEQMITSLPDVEYAELNPETDKFIVLACDGIWNSMTSQQVVDFVSDKISKSDTKLSQICDELFKACLASDTGGDGTGCDNMTAIIVRINNTEATISEEPISTEKCVKSDEVNSSDGTIEMEIEEGTSKISTSLKRSLNGVSPPSSPETGEKKRLKLDKVEEPI